MNPTDPAVEVNTAHNGHFIGGLVNATKVEDDVYVGDNKDYLTKTYVSVGDAFISFISAGIFAPTTTKFYLPYGSEMPEKVKMPPVKFGVRGGVNFSSPTGDGGYYREEFSPSLTTGFKVGAILDVPMTHSVYFQPGIYYSQTGAKIAGEKYNQTGWEIPLLLSFRFGVPNILASVTNGNSFTKNMQLQVHFGPYIALGKAQRIDNYSGDKSNDEMEDLGLQVGAGGLFMKHVYLGLSYEFGFWGQDLGPCENVSRRNFSIVAGFNF